MKEIESNEEKEKKNRCEEEKDGKGFNAKRHEKVMAGERRQKEGMPQERDAQKERTEEKE